MSRKKHFTFKERSLKAGSHDAIFGSAEFLLRLKEVSDAKQYFYELKQCQLKKERIRKSGCVN